MFGKKKTNANKAILDEADALFEGCTFAFLPIRNQIEDFLAKNEKEFSEMLKSAGQQRSHWIYTNISNMAGDMVESGEYHLHRGVLNPMGEQFLTIFEQASDKLVQLGVVTADAVVQQKTAIRENIANVG